MVLRVTQRTCTSAQVIGFLALNPKTRLRILHGIHGYYGVILENLNSGNSFLATFRCLRMLKLMQGCVHRWLTLMRSPTNPKDFDSSLHQFTSQFYIQSLGIPSYFYITRLSGVVFNH